MCHHSQKIPNYHLQPLFILKCYTVLSVSDDLSVLSGSKWVLIWISFFFLLPLPPSFLNPNSSSLPCLWCWQYYTSIRQRFVNVFHQLNLCMFACHCGSCVLSSGSHFSWRQNYKRSFKDESSLISLAFTLISAKSPTVIIDSRHQIRCRVLLLSKTHHTWVFYWLS